MRFKLYNDWNCENEKLYVKSFIDIKPGVTVLVGCNGIGKSTLIKQIKKQLRDKDIPDVSYNDLADGRYFAMDKSLNVEKDLKKLATQATSSEGENILINIGSYAYDIGKFISKNNSVDDIFIFFDAVDSGLSIDNIIDMKRNLFNTILENEKDKNVYIIVSANGYEMANGENCFDVAKCKHVRFKDYEDYKKCILESKEYKDKRSSYV